MGRWLELDSLDNTSIAAATLVGSYTATADIDVYCTLYAQGLAGGGDYIYYIDVTPSGLSAGEALKTTQTLGATTYVLFAQSIPVSLRNGDVMAVYLDGLAGDTTTPDIRVNFYESPSLQPTTAGNKADVQSTGEVGLDFSNIKAATGATTLTNITVPVTATVTDLAAIFSGITSLPKWLRGLFRKDAMDSTAKTEINTGGGTFSELTDSLEAVRDNEGTAGAGLTALGDTRIANLDAAVSTRLASSGYTAPPSASAINTTLSAAHGSGTWGGASGSGAVEFVYTVTNAVGGLPIAQTFVWVTTDDGGDNIVGSGYTDDFGDVTFYLDPGTFYFWRKKSGYNFTNPDMEVVS